jgi:alginate O-acetyltransferase complex protein AlgJ
MTKFLLKVFIFLLMPVLTVLIIGAFLPITFFTYRTWEAISFKTNVSSYAPFYPNTISNMIGVGDLCHHSSFSIAKKEYWITDKYGFRNDKFNSSPDIVIIGDSFIAGASLSQEEIISNQLIKQDKKLAVYNMAPSSFSTFDYYLKTGKINKPRLIIFSMVERNLPSPIKTYKSNFFNEAIKNIIEFGDFNEYLDRAFKFSSIKWLTARFHDSKGSGIPSKENLKMFFLQGSSNKHSADDLNFSARIIISYKKYCDSLGVDFLFLPMPDKESVYFELVPFDKQPTYLSQLDSLLNIAHVSTINTLEIYNEYRKTSNMLLYHLDDTHWNANATKIVSKEILQKISPNNQYSIR